MKAHFGSAEDPLPEFAKFNGYLNIDTGTGRLRGASVFGPPEDGDDPGASILAPFKDLKIGGATGQREPRDRRHRQHVVQQRRPAGHRLQPGLASNTAATRTTPTSTPTSASIEQDVRDAAVVVAGTLYQLAMRDEPLPRFAADKMPPPAAARRRRQ